MKEFALLDTHTFLSVHLLVEVSNSRAADGPEQGKDVLHIYLEFLGGTHHLVLEIDFKAQSHPCNSEKCRKSNRFHAAPRTSPT